MASGLVLPQGLTEDVLAEWQRDNPRATPQDGIRAYINHRAKKEGKPPDQVLLEVYPGLGGVPPPAGAQLGSPGFAGGAVPYQGTPPTTPRQAAHTLGDAALAMTPLGGTSRLARIGTKALQGGVTHGGIDAVAATNEGGFSDAAQQGLTGGITGALQGGLGQTVGEVLPYAVRTTQNIGTIAREHLATTANRLRWAARDARDAFEGIVEAVPDFIRVLPGARGMTDALSKLTQAPAGSERVTRALGRQYLGEAIEKSEQQVKKVLGGASAEVHVPTIWRAITPAEEVARYGQVHTGALPTPGTPARTVSTPSTLLGPNGQPLPPTQTQVPGTPGTPGVPGVVMNVTPPMTVQAALDGLKQMTAEAMASGRGFASHALWEAVEKGKTELLARVPPDLAKLYRADLAKFGRGLAIINALQESGALESKSANAVRGAFDADAFLSHLREKGLLEFFPGLTYRLTRGAEAGAREAIKSMPRGRIYRLGESATFALPGLRTQARGGSPNVFAGVEPNPYATGLSLRTLGEIGRGASAEPGSYVDE